MLVMVGVKLLKLNVVGIWMDKNSFVINVKKLMNKPIGKEKIKCPYLERYGAHFEYCSYCFPLKVKTQNEKTNTERKNKI